MAFFSNSKVLARINQLEVMVMATMTELLAKVRATADLLTGVLTAQAKTGGEIAAVKGKVEELTAQTVALHSQVLSLQQQLVAAQQVPDDVITAVDALQVAAEQVSQNMQVLDDAIPEVVPVLI